MNKKEAISKKTMQNLRAIVYETMQADFEQHSKGLKLADVVPNTSDLVDKVIEDVWLQEFTARELNLFVDFYAMFSTKVPVIIESSMDYLSFYLELHKTEVEKHMQDNGKSVPETK